jgi:hypothetical protein
MTYEDWLWIKLAVFCVGAFVYGLWRGLNGH